MKVHKALLIPQVGCVLTLVTELVTHVLKSPANSTRGRHLSQVSASLCICFLSETSH